MPWFNYCKRRVELGPCASLKALSCSGAAPSVILGVCCLEDFCVFTSMYMWNRYYFILYHEISVCLHPVELMQLFPLTSAGLGLVPSPHITLEMLLMETSYFAIQDPKQSQVPPRLLPAKPRCFLPVHEHSHSFPSHPGPGEKRAGSSSPPLAWDAEFSWTTPNFQKHLLPPHHPSKRHHQCHTGS